MCIKNTLYFRYRNSRKKKNNENTVESGYYLRCTVDVNWERLSLSVISWSIQDWKKPFWTSNLSEVRAIYYSSIQWAKCALHLAWRSFPKAYMDVSRLCKSGSLLVFPSYTIPENTFKDGIHSLTLDRNDIAIYIRIDHQVVLSVVQFEKSWPSRDVSLWRGDSLIKGCMF